MMSAGCRFRGDHADDRREEHEGEKEKAGDDGYPPGTSADADSGGRLDVGRRRRGGGSATGDRAEPVDEERLSDLRQAALLVQVAGRLADADERSHRVEEVRHEEGERPHDGRDERELRERVEVEVAEELEVRALVDVARDRGPRCEARVAVGGLVDDRRERRCRDDPDQEVAAHSACSERDRQREPEGRDEDRPRRQRTEVDYRCAWHHDPSALEADERDEEADPDRDRLLQIEGDRIHHLLAKAGEHEDRDRDALDDDEAHCSREESPSPATSAKATVALRPRPGAIA